MSQDPKDLAMLLARLAQASAGLTREQKIEALRNVREKLLLKGNHAAVAEADAVLRDLEKGLQ